MNFIDGIWYNLHCHKDEIAGTNICDHVENNVIYPWFGCPKPLQEIAKVGIV
jgi:hypothetical protein